jgi:glyoxylate reductase
VVARVFVTRALVGDALDRLHAAHEVEMWDGDLPPEPAVLAEKAQGAAGLLTMLTDRIDANLLDGAPTLRAIANYAVGSDNIDLEAAKTRGVAVGTTPDVLTDATADLAWGLLLASARRLPAAHASVPAGGWRTWVPRGFLGADVHGATLGVIGYGRIGRAMAKRSAGFAMRVLVAGRDPAGIDRVLRESDFVSIHTPLTSTTRGLIDAQALAKMKPTAHLVNTARGPIVDTDALAEALHAGRIAGAALDVTDPEPLPADHPLLSAPNLIVLPHIGSATTATRARMTEMAVENLLEALAGRPMPHPA